ncbi:BamA/TamA family outer membrane protein [Vibrio sp. SS-MA-C1-2]|uniref:BamA/TamA family outer membrane protein n=1 Tax=Vibrio sp. SS-MA-C1-2 TaxID=2908646 RepID=UPI001F4887B2|nr:BamA/TamA family outer membrane protein [Vibrio sp. SS-MA-C1-2]UJF17579.1 BamA/TamA family outer membrane protein [Vibrio sp. SS-MA-C1-2]
MTNNRAIKIGRQLACYSLSLTFYFFSFSFSSLASIDKKNYLLAPQLTNGPKMGFSGGAVAAYLKKFDPESPPSMFGVTGTYSNTDSYMGALFAKTYWDSNRRWLTAAYLNAEIKNDYNNFSFDGSPNTSLSSTQDVQVGFLRYQQEFKRSGWYMGGHIMYVENYPSYIDIHDISNSDQLLSQYGFTDKQDNVGIGLDLTYDTRDNIYDPKKGSFFNFVYTHYDENFGGDYTFNSYKFNYTNIHSFNTNALIATNTSWLYNPDSPPTSQATLQRYRGYTSGEARGESAWIGQTEFRYKVWQKISVATFAGLATVTNEFDDLGHSDNWYPMVGAGMRYLIKPKQKIVLRLDYAQGKSGDHGLYLKIGQPF